MRVSSVKPGVYYVSRFGVPGVLDGSDRGVGVRVGTSTTRVMESVWSSVKSEKGLSTTRRTDLLRGRVKSVPTVEPRDESTVEDPRRRETYTQGDRILRE